MDKEFNAEDFVKQYDEIEVSKQYVQELEQEISERLQQIEFSKKRVDGEFYKEYVKLCNKYDRELTCKIQIDPLRNTSQYLWGIFRRKDR